MSHTLLFEVGTEELPPSELPAVLRALETAAARMLGEAWVSYRSLRVYSTPRRLAVAGAELAERQERRVVTVTGPPKKAAFDTSGAPTRAAEGFARAQGVPVDRLKIVPTDRGEYLAVEREEGGQATADVLPALLSRLVASLPFAKQMRWEQGGVRFSRPIRWVLALIDGQVLPMTVAGCEAGRVTYGHRFLAAGPIVLSTPDEYLSRLREARVIADVDVRRQEIRRQIEDTAGRHGFRPVIDEATLDAVVHLVEAPMAVVGSFAKVFLDLPREVVEAPIRRHQRCFTAEGPDGSLLPFFVAVSNMPGCDPTEIRRGNERVIGARLADADFYFKDDLRGSPEARLPLLASMVFQERLGSLLEKAERTEALTEHLSAELAPATRLAVTRAARLSKTDLASGMVREFPELQGIIGETYALRSGEPAPVARAIREQYLPRGAEDELPTSTEGGILAIADKIDTVVGCMGVGLVPTGSQDPYALRRQAQGVIQIALGARFVLSLAGLVDRALALLGGKLTESTGTTRDRVLEFLRSRLATVMVARGLRADVVEAVLNQGFDDPVSAVQRAEAITRLMSRSDWEALVIAFKRAINILPARTLGEPEPARFVDDAERGLYEQTLATRPRVLAALARADYETALTELAALRPAVDRFFDAVMVMDGDLAIRENRLGLLRALVELVLPIADLRQIQSAAP
ncbi:MAG: glycine--tRNA ligase subunit beta [Candidatus Rokuibacteriota bacterium]